MRSVIAHCAASSGATPRPSWPKTQAQGCGRTQWCNKVNACELVATQGRRSDCNSSSV